MLMINVPWSTVDTIILLSYFVIMVLIAIRFTSKANKSMSNYFLSGRSLTLPLVIGTMMTSWYDGYSVIGVAEYGATIGIAGMIVYVIPCTLTRIPFALWIAPLIRGRLPDDCLTIPDLMEYLYDKKAKFLGAISVIAGVLYNGVNFLVISQLMQFMFDLPAYVAIIASGIILAIYILVSGMWSVSMTDVFQLVYMSISIGVATIMVMQYTGGWEAIYAALGTEQPALFQPTGGMPPMTALAWALIGMSIYTEPMMYQRFSASNSVKTAKRSFMFCIPMWLVFSSAVIMIGFCARTLHPDLVFYEAFWTTTLGILPVGLRGFFAAGFIAAVLSTLSSYILVQSTAVTKDIYSVFSKKPLDDRTLIKWNKIATVIIIIFSMMSTQAWLESILDGLFFVTGFQVAGTFVPLVVGLFHSKRTAQAGWIATAFGFIFYIFWQFILQGPWGIPANNITWLLSLIVYFVVWKITYRKPEETLEKLEA
jgi:SSS family solute:Na+ symporter